MIVTTPSTEIGTRAAAPGHQRTLAILRSARKARSIRTGDLRQHGAGELVLGQGYDDSPHQAEPLARRCATYGITASMAGSAFSAL